MGLRFEFDVTGVDGVEEALDELGDQLMPALVNGLKKGAAEVSATAREIVPVDTSELQKSIRARAPTVDGNTASVEVKATAEHAVYVEMGTGERGAASTFPEGMEAAPSYATGHGGQEAQPYMFPALKQNEPRIREEIAKAVKKAVNG